MGAQASRKSGSRGFEEGLFLVSGLISMKNRKNSTWLAWKGFYSLFYFYILTLKELAPDLARSSQ